MLFNSVDFLIFFPIVTILFFVIPQKIKPFWLLAASYYFYMCWNVRYVLLLLFSTAVTFASGLLMDMVERKWKEKAVFYKKLCVAGSFILNLSVLFVFKYFNFVIDNLNSLFAKTGFEFRLQGPDLLLPVGISFYIFQALSYTMDVYRKEIKAEKNFFKYALFVSFFPQLVAGPIERSKNLIRQIHKEHHFDCDRVRMGLLIMMWGYFQKLVIADRAGILVDQVYGDLSSYHGMAVLLASVLFAIQIYCDFSGYSMIAIGAARVMGFDLMKNFDCPYFAVSVAEFWRRWHISLTSWFRDYLYIPLGGNRKGKARKYLNIMIVFLVSGLWHGAAWTYVIWGGLNGLFQVVSGIWEPVRKKIEKALDLRRESAGHRFLKTLITFVLVDFTWIFFRADTIKDAFCAIRTIVTDFDPWALWDGSLYQLGLNNRQLWLLIYTILFLLIVDYLKTKKFNFVEGIVSQDWWCRWILYVGGLMFILVFGIWGVGFDAQAFVYFQF